MADPTVVKQASQLSVHCTGDISASSGELGASSTPTRARGVFLLCRQEAHHLPTLPSLPVQSVGGRA